jgi:hypothetical protein
MILYQTIINRTSVNKLEKIHQIEQSNVTRTDMFLRPSSGSFSHSYIPPVPFPLRIQMNMESQVWYVYVGLCHVFSEKTVYSMLKVLGCSFTVYMNTEGGGSFFFCMHFPPFFFSFSSFTYKIYGLIFA